MNPFDPTYKAPIAPVMGGQVNSRGFRPDSAYKLPGPQLFEVEWMLNQFRIDTDYNPYENYDPSVEGYMSKNQTMYDNERELYRVLLAEAYNLNGMPGLWHVVTFDTAYDPIFKEDNNKRVERVFPFMMYMPETPDNNRLWTLMGIEGVNDFTFWISKDHFREASQCEVTEDYSGLPNPNGIYETDFSKNFVPSMNQDGATGDEGHMDRTAFDDSFDVGKPIIKEHFPKVGDVFKLDYDGGTWFEVKRVREEDEEFLQRKHVWVIETNKLYINEHIDPNIDNVNFDSGFKADIQDRSDEFDQTQDVKDIVDSTDTVPETFPTTTGKGKPSPMYNPLAGEIAPKNPFGGFRR